MSRHFAGCREYLLEQVTLVTIFTQAAHGTLQGLPSHTLASPSLANNHVAMSGHFAVKDLYDLGDELRHDLHMYTQHSGTQHSEAGCAMPTPFDSSAGMLVC